MKKRILSITLILFCLSILLADNIIPIRTDVSGFATWTDVDVNGTTYLQLQKATSSTTTPSMDFSQFSGVQLLFKARSYMGTNVIENTITVSISENNGSSWTVLGTRIPPSNSLTSITPFDLSAYNNTQVKIKFTVAGTDNSIGAGIDDITISGTPAGAANAPVISAFTQVTIPPFANTNFPISATVTDADGQDNIAVVEVSYKINNGDTQFSNLFNSVENPTIYTGSIPESAYNNGDLVEYWITAMDADDPFHLVESTTQKFFAGITPISTLRTMDANGFPVYNTLLCRISGVALNSDGALNALTVNDAFIQDATGGIDAYKSPQLASFNFVQGNSYSISGKITQYNGKCQIELTEAQQTGTPGVGQPQNVTIAQLLANPENYEGELIRLNNVNKTSGTWPSTNSNASLSISDGTATTLYIYKYTLCYTQPEPEWPVNIVGIFSQFDSSSPYSSGYQVLVRSINDFSDNSTLPVTFSTFDAVSTSANMVNIQWVTQTETAIHGYYIYRNTENSTTNAQRISSLIPANNSTTPHTYEYQDTEVTPGQTYYYWIVSLEQNESSSWFGPRTVTVLNPETPEVLPTATSLIRTYPNPFNQNNVQKIELEVKEAETAELNIFNVKGQTVKTYSNIPQGKHELTWDGKDNNNNKCASGMYFYRLSSPTTTIMKKVMIVK